MKSTAADLLFRVVVIRRSDGTRFVVRENLSHADAEHIRGILPELEWERCIEPMAHSDDSE